MAYVVFPIESDARALKAKIDLALGWPKVGAGVCQRRHVGGGRHVDHPACCTTGHAEVIKHPTLSSWAVPIDDTSRPYAGLVVEAELASSWITSPAEEK